MVGERLRPQWERTSVVAVTPAGAAVVVTRVGGDEARHRHQPLAVSGRRAQAEPLAIESRKQEELHHEAVVRRRSFEVDAVGLDLSLDLRRQDVPAERRPPLRRSAGAEEETGEHEPGGVGRVVIATHVGTLEIPLDPVSVEIERTEES